MSSEPGASPVLVAPGEARIARPGALEHRDLDEQGIALVEGAVERLADPGRVGPSWRVRPLIGGASNMNFLVTEDGDERAEYVLRVSSYDTERIGGTRADGLRIQSNAANGGVGAPVLAYCLPEGHSLSRFIPGDALSPALLRERGHWAAAARLMRRMHDLPAVEATWSAYSDIDRYAAMARAEGLALPADWDRLYEAAETVRRACDDHGASHGFCHNDLQIQNFIDDGDRLWLLDWEWAGMGDRYFDLGGFLVNAEADEGERHEFLDAYFDGDYDEEAAVARCQLMELVSAVREASWAIAAEPILDNDWDYQAWAAEYFERARAIMSSDRFEGLLGRVRAASAGERPR
ncbi:MAG: phosphotransferase [Thermoleophilia bacterium]|nr:phosphotransferase [Thermoleophilia bacterium]